MKQYQLLPSLTKEEYEALKDDIARRGVQVPIEFDESGNVLDGHHRLLACKELGIKDYPSIIRGGMTEEEKTQHVLSLNLNRRHLGIEQRKELHTKLREMGWSLRKIANVTKVDDKTVENDLSGAEFSAPERVTGRDGKSYPSVMAKNKREATRTFRAMATMPIGLLPDKMLDVKRVERLAREHRADERSKDAEDLIIGSSQLLLGDFRERGEYIPDESVDMIFTDPPYPKDFLPLWSDLGQFAARVLRPDGMLIAYTGAMWLPAVISYLGENLDFFWSGAVIMPGAHSRVHNKNVVQGSKPLLFYTKPGYSPGEWFEDTYFSEGEQKDNHDWQQSIGLAKYYISKLTTPGALIVDPFLGGGTTAIAAIGSGRHFVGIEIDPVAFATSSERLREWIKKNEPLWVQKSETNSSVDIKT